MDKPSNAPPPNPGYETSDAQAGRVFKFLAAMAVMLILCALVCWGLFWGLLDALRGPAGERFSLRGHAAVAARAAAASESSGGLAEISRGAGRISRKVRLGKSRRWNRSRADRRSDAVAGEKGSSRAGRARRSARRSEDRSPRWEQEAMKFKFQATLVLAVTTLTAFSARAQQATTPAILGKVGITQNLNAQIPPDLMFRDESGQTVRIGDYFGQKPIVLSLVYFDCPALCTEVLNGELRTMDAISLNLGKDFEAITVSFEPKDTPALAKAKRDVYLGQYGRPGAVDHWHFLTGDQPSIDALTNVAGFRYAYDSSIHQYAHATAILLLTPDGRIDRYYYGVQYPARDVRLGLVEASQGKIGTLTDHALLYCYQYDPMTGKYGLVIMNVLRVAGGLTVLILGIFMTMMFLRERKRPSGIPPAAGAKVR